MKYGRVLGKAFVLFGVLFLPCIAKADHVTSRGAALAYACAACHGPDGHSQGAIPSLDSLLPEDFQNAMRTFRTETHQSTVMHYIAKGFGDADIEAMAVYFATMKSR
jgi:sulfide dehydrogenase cytochrome subunit